MKHLHVEGTVCALLVWAGSALALPAFPEAIGFGSETVGGRGGAICEVTNLNDSGGGSFRACVQMSGPRIVVFRVGGTILLKSLLRFDVPFITIAGQTAPGGGIALQGKAVAINTHNVLLRHVRFRLGDAYSPGAADTVGILPKASNVVFDHVSVTWGVDENFSVYGATAHDVTISNSIIAEGLHDSLHSDGPHSMGTLTKYATRVSHIGNLYAHNNDRNPLIGNGTGQEFALVNSVIYNWGYTGTKLNNGGTGTKMIVQGNVYRSGKNSTLSNTVAIESSSGTKVYIADLMRNGVIPADAWSLVKPTTSPMKTTTPPFALGFTPRPVGDVQAYVLAHVGATPWNRDAVDSRLVADVLNGTGTIINSQTQVGGYPQLAAGTPPQDTDHDGMPDEWETANGLNPTNAADGKQDKNNDGYTNVEEYLNGLPLTTPEPPPTQGFPPAAPTDVQGTQTVTVIWEYPEPDATHSAATGARVERSIDGGEFLLACTAMAPDNNCVDTEPQDMGHEYRYRLFLTNAAGDGPPSPVQ